MSLAVSGSKLYSAIWCWHKLDVEFLEGAARDINVHVVPGWDALVEIRCGMQGWV